MIPKELLKKVRKIEIRTRHLVENVFSGEYHSVFKGLGMEFSEVREYQIGDDIRTIDWNVTARMGTPYVKKFMEERELTVVILFDLSSSGEFGTVRQLKSEIATEICAVLSFSAIKNNDRVGLILFTDKIEKYIPPKKGRQHILRIIRELLYFKPEHNRTDLNVALEYLNKILKRRAIVFIVSDFLSKNFTKSLSVTNKKNDCIAITIIDPREIKFPKLGFVALEDSETGNEMVINTSDMNLISSFNKKSNDEINSRRKIFLTNNVDYIEVFTDKPYIEPLLVFFRKRALRFR